MSVGTISPVCAPRQGTRAQLAETIAWIFQHSDKLINEQRCSSCYLTLSRVRHSARELATGLYLLDDGRLYLESHRVGLRGISGITFSSLHELHAKALTPVAAAGYIDRLEELIGDLAALIS